MNVCTRQLDWRDHPPHDADSCICTPEMDQTDEEIRQGRVEGAIGLLVEVELKHFTVEDLRRLRHLLEMEIALRD